MNLVDMKLVSSSSDRLKQFQSHFWAFRHPHTKKVLKSILMLSMQHRFPRLWTLYTKSIRKWTCKHCGCLIWEMRVFVKWNLTEKLLKYLHKPTKDHTNKENHLKLFLLEWTCLRHWKTCNDMFCVLDLASYTTNSTTTPVAINRHLLYDSRCKICGSILRENFLHCSWFPFKVTKQRSFWYTHHHNRSKHKHLVLNI